uniref:TAFA chemokine like family member 5 n=1 Tax=Scleropages formosus TaxID=113540 RepID=A0A8C9WQE9_SCLFO
PPVRLFGSCQLSGDFSELAGSPRRIGVLRDGCRAAARPDPPHPAAVCETVRGRSAVCGVTLAGLRVSPLRRSRATRTAGPCPDCASAGDQRCWETRVVAVGAVQGPGTRRNNISKDGQLAAGTCEIVTLDRDSSQPRRTIARQTARCACKKGQIAGTTRARPACVEGRTRVSSFAHHVYKHITSAFKRCAACSGIPVAALPV